MNAYTARSLYDEDDEEDDEEVERTGGVGLTVSHQPGEVYNDSPTQVIIVALYGIKDTLQVAHVEKQKILPNSSCIFSCLQESSKYPLPEYNLHIHFPGLMGLISPRTLQSSGYGFKVQAGESYHVSLLSKKDIKGNKCAIFRANSLGPEASLESTVYKFGDMLLRPSARLAKRVFKLSNLNLKPALYTEYRLRRKSQLSYDGPSTSSRAVQSSGSGHAYDTEQKIDELEVWGLFFDDICTIGVSLCKNTYQQTGLTCSEEEGKLEAAWITVDDIDLQEPFLFIGLPACALFKTIFRSFSDTDGIVLMNAQRVVRETCPESFREMFDMLMVTKTSLVDIEQGTETGNGKEKGPHLQQADLLWMQQFLLYSSSDQEITITPERGGPSLERQTQFRHALSHLVGVCIQLTQQPYFKENFMNVLEEISHRVSV